MSAAFELADRILRHLPLAAARIIAAATRGHKATIAEGMQIEAEQFARMAAIGNTREGLDAWIGEQKPCYARY